MDLGRGLQAAEVSQEHLRELKAILYLAALDLGFAELRADGEAVGLRRYTSCDRGIYVMHGLRQ